MSRISIWSIGLLLLVVGLSSAADLRPDERLALEAFDHELSIQTVAAHAGKAAADPERMVKAARDRRSVLRRLVREDPEQAVAVALDRVRRKNVPAAARGELEQEISALGALEVRVTSPNDVTQAPQILRQAAINGQRYDVTTWGAGLGDHSAARRSLHGVAVDGVLALVPGRLRVLKPGEEPLAGKRLDDQRCSVSGKLAGANQEPDDGLEDVIVESGDAVHVLCQGGHITQLGDAVAAAEAGSTKLASAWTTGAKKVLYVIARCSDEVGFPQTVSSADSMMTTVADYYQTTSWGQTTMTWETIEVVLPKTTTQYSGTSGGDYTLLTDARAAAVALDPKYALANWDFDAVRHSSLFGGWSGQGYVGGKGTWLQSSNAGVACHELGHNYGLWHANFWNTSEVSSIGAGVNNEYGDPYSTMGNAGGLGQFTTYEKWRLDWITSSNVQDITTSGTYRVYASDSATAPSSSAMYGLRITKDSQRDYWISHRRQFTSNQWNQNGVFLHWDPWAITGIGDSKSGGHLLDTTPGTAQGRNDAALVRGRTFSDRSTNIHITPMSLNTGTTPVSMDVVVNLGSFPGNHAPTVSLSASALSVATGANVDFTATANDSDGDALAVYWDFADDTFASNTLTTSKSWSTAKEYPVRVTVSDMKGGTASATVVVKVGTVTTFRISGTVRGIGGIGMEGIRVHRGTTTGSVWSNSDGSYTLANLPAANYTVAAQYDGYTFAQDFVGQVAVGPNATGKDFSLSNTAPTVATPAAASPSPVANKTTTLSVLGADDGGEASLRYAWAVTGSPPAAVTFTANNSNAAKSSLATFTKAGSYPIQVTISDLVGQSVTSAIAVTVSQTNTIITVTPATPVVHVGSPQTFVASSTDQFGDTLTSPPAFTWTVSGGKTINAGVVAASSTVGGPYTVTASTTANGTRSGTTTFTVVNDAPTIAAIADLATAADTATSAVAVTINDTETAANLLTLSKATSDATLVPTANIVLAGSGANRTVTVTPATGKTGTVTITLTVADGNGSSTAEAFALYVGVPLPSGAASSGGGGGGGGCGLGAGVSALLAMLALMAQRFVDRHQRHE